MIQMNIIKNAGVNLWHYSGLLSSKSDPLSNTDLLTDQKPSNVLFKHKYYEDVTVMMTEAAIGYD